MLSESERRAARLAVAWFSVEPALVQHAVRAVVAARTAGDTADLLTTLEQRGVLTPGQVQQLQLGLAEANVDADPIDFHVKRPRAGTAVADPERIGAYRVLRRLGEGGMGSVFLAYDEAVHGQIAIKVLSQERADVPGLLDRFRREGQSGVLLNHPNIVHAFEAGLDRTTGLHFLVLEYVDGPSAQSLLERFGRLAIGDAVRIVLDIARGLAYAHSRSIIHRDIKPGNILLTASGQAKLSDLGLAKKVDEISHLTSARQGVGTPYYIPYEQALNAKKADARSDIYALGATLYHLITGEVPFPGDSNLEVVERKSEGKYVPARALNAEVPAALEAILARMLARHPEERYQTADEMVVELERSGLAAGTPSLAVEDQPLVDASADTHNPEQATVPDLRLERPLRRKRSPAPPLAVVPRRRWAWWAMVVIVVVLLVWGVMYLR
jgi:serine/threonine-protein kinase